MRYLKYIYLGIGLSLFLWLIIESDPRTVLVQLSRIGWIGFISITLIYGVAFLVDTLSWQLTFNTVALNKEWLGKLFVIRVVGEAFNTVIPAASLGGEPVKAFLLKRNHSISYRESGATLILAKTINLLALILFLCLGLLLMIQSELIPGSLKVIALTGLIVLTTGTVMFLLVQRLQISTWLITRASKRPVINKLARFIEHIREVDEHFLKFYTARRPLFYSAIGLAMANWLIGTIEVFIMMLFLGHPVSIENALIIESMAQLVRAGTFFIPASIGAQEGAFVISISLLTGSADVGLAAALLRRCRELVWVAPGLLLAWLWSVQPELAAEKKVKTNF